MAIYKYLSLTPESLIVSMLPPEAFGTYLATGSQKLSSEIAIYFDLKENFKSDYFRLEEACRDCVPHPNGTPKRSVYVSTYRVLEHVPIDAIQSLWLTTRDGRVLQLKQASNPYTANGGYHLYQELCPVNPLIASIKNPVEFCRFITDPAVRISVPKICFFELQLGTLQDNPTGPIPADLPYKHIEHLRDCLLELANVGKTTKTVTRIQTDQLQYRVIKSGFFVGDRQKMLYFPFPSLDQLETVHHNWWRSANLV